jgi:hypothetical protein
MKKITLLLAAILVLINSNIAQEKVQAKKTTKGESLKQDNTNKSADPEISFQQALQKGKQAEASLDYAGAKNAYIEALILKPEEPDLLGKIEMLDKKLTEENALNSEYDSARARGDRAGIEGKYSAALSYYKQAQKLKPAETYPVKQEKWIISMMEEDSIKLAQESAKPNQDSLNEAQQKKKITDLQFDIQRKRAKEGLEAYAKYYKAADKGDLEMEVFYLKKFLNIIPNDSIYYKLYNPNQYSEDPILFAKTKIKAIRDYLTRVKGSAYQADVDSIPYLDQELEQKYEDLNFKKLPAEQIMVALDTISLVETIKQTKEFVSEKSRLKLQDSAAGVRLSCETINFIGGRMFVKLKIRNYSESDFLTGQMYLSVKKKGGALIKNYPDYISSRPIVLPGKEFAFIYGTKDVSLEKNDSLVFELSDRYNKKNFTINIPAESYLAEKNRIK